MVDTINQVIDNCEDGANLIDFRKTLLALVFILQKMPKMRMPDL